MFLKVVDPGYISSHIEIPGCLLVRIVPIVFVMYLCIETCVWRLVSALFVHCAGLRTRHVKCVFRDKIYVANKTPIHPVVSFSFRMSVYNETYIQQHIVGILTLANHNLGNFWTYAGLCACFNLVYYLLSKHVGSVLWFTNSSHTNDDIFSKKGKLFSITIVTEY